MDNHHNHHHHHNNLLLMREYQEGQVHRAGNQRRHLIKMADSPLLAKRGVPILFMLVCSLIIVNTRCDQVGSANESGDKINNSKQLSTSELIEQVEQAEKQQQQAASPQATKAAAAKYDPLNMLREIYLDHNSKVTMLMPLENDPADDNHDHSKLKDTTTMQDLQLKLLTQVKSAQLTMQKFHPNGRYGRRSVDNSYAEPHSELAKLVYNEPTTTNEAGGLSPGALRSLLGHLDHANNANKQPYTAINQSFGARGADTAGNGANYQHELAKLLKCNYSGVSSLYWCNSATPTGPY